MLLRIGLILAFAFSVTLIAHSSSHAQPISKPTPQTIFQSTAFIAPRAFNVNEGPLFVDVDFDRIGEFVIAGGYLDSMGFSVGEIYAFKLDGNLLFSTGTNFASLIPPLSADLAGDNQLVVGDGYYLHQLVVPVGTQKLVDLPGWPQAGGAEGVTVLENILGDSTKETIHLTYDSVGKFLNVRSRSGAFIAPWPLNLESALGFDFSDLADEVDTRFAVGDTDGDGQREIAISGVFPSDTSDDVYGVLALNPDTTVNATVRETDPGVTYLSSPAIADDGVDQWIAQGYTRDDEGDQLTYGGIKVFRRTASNVLVRDDYEFSYEDTVPQFSPIFANIAPSVSGLEMLVVDNGAPFPQSAEYPLIDPISRIQALRASTGGKISVGEWPLNLPNGSDVTGTPVVGDIDNDGDQELLVPTNHGLYGFHHDLESYMVVNGTSTDLTASQSSSNCAYRIRIIQNPIAGAANTAVWFSFVEAEEDNDFVYIYPADYPLPSSGPCYATDRETFHQNYPAVQTITGVYKGWSVSVPGSGIKLVLSSDLSVNYSGYRVQKILSGTSLDFRKLVSGSGNSLQPYVRIAGSPTLGDANGDGALDLGFVTTTRQARLFNLNVPYRPEKLEWPMFRHDPGRTNTYTVPSPRPANTAPKLQTIGTQYAYQTNLLQFTLHAVDAEGQPLTYAFESALPPGANYNASTRTFQMTPPLGTVPASQNSRDFTVKFSVTDGSFRDEEVVTITVLKSGIADLIVQGAPAIHGGVLQVGNWVNFSAIVKNQGNAPINGFFRTSFEIDIGSSTFTSVDVELEPQNVRPLSAGESVEVISSAWPEIPLGTHTLRVCADRPLPVVSESTTANNCSTLTLAVGLPPDLTLTGAPFINSGVPGEGGTLNFGVMVRNQANAIALGLFDVVFQIDLFSTSFSTPDLTLEPPPTFGRLVGNTTIQMTSADWTNLPIGTHTVRACVNESEPRVVESDHTNNCTSSTVTVGPPAFDFSIKASDTNINVDAGATGRMMITVKRVGLAAAQPISIASVQTLPSGTTYTVTPTSCTPSGTATSCQLALDLRTSISTPISFTPLTVTAVKNGVTRQAKFSLQVRGTPFQQSSETNRFVSIEAEHSDERTITIDGGVQHGWSPTTQSGASNASQALVSVPSNAVPLGPDADALAIRNRRGHSLYRIRFVKTGTHYVWVRALSRDPGDTASVVRIGFNGTLVETARNVSANGADWTWSTKSPDGVRAKISVPTLGTHTLSVWMDKGNTVLDKIVLTNNGSYKPTSTGPNESPRQ